MEDLTVQHLQLATLIVAALAAVVIIYRRQEWAAAVMGLLGLVFCAVGIPTCVAVPAIAPLMLLSAGLSVWLLVLGAKSSVPEPSAPASTKE